MGDKIFLIGEKGDLRPMAEKPYDTEDVLQALLERYPDLLVGDQVDPESPRRWLLVKREMGVPDAEDSAGRWSLDHLFLDQDGVLTLVEVKRVTDTRCRREVVAQMLDYAANAVLYWPVEKVISSFERTVSDSGRVPSEVLADFLGDQGSRTSTEEFWTNVKTNLEAERIRMVFVADEIPRELKRIVEFLNGQMDPARVVAVEVKQYVSADGALKTLVPRVVGQTMRAARKTMQQPREAWDEPRFMEAARKEGGPNTVKVCKRIIEWFNGDGKSIRWMPGTPHFAAVLKLGGEEAWILEAFASGELCLLLKVIEDEKLRAEFRDRLASIRGIKLSKALKEPRLDPNLDSLANDETWREFTGALEWLIGTYKATT